MGGVIGAGLLLAVYFGNSIGSTEGNPLSTAIKLLLPVLMVYALVWPKHGLYLLLFETAYLDLLKRLMVIFGDINKTDISISLAAAPVTLASICVGLVVKRALRKREPLKNESLLLTLMFGLLGVVIVSALRSDDDITGKLQRISESGAYITLIFVIPVLLPTLEDLTRFARVMVFAYLPVALYGLWQYFVGIADFEVTYMLTGLSMLVKEMDDVKPRIFSTLNSNHVFSVVMAFCCALCFIRDWSGSTKVQMFKSTYGKLFCQAVFAFAVIMSLRRTGWVVLASVFAGYHCFKSPVRTVVFYSAAIALMVFLFVNADYIDQNWQAWQQYLPLNNDFQEQAFRIGTFTDRVHSYNSVLYDTSLWSWFGLGRGNQMLTHDAIGDTLVSYGAVGLVLIAAFTIGGLHRFHVLVFNHRSQKNFHTLVLLMSLITANLFGSILFQTHIVIFPANFFFWLCVGSLFALTMEAAAEAEAPAEERREVLRRRAMPLLNLAPSKGAQPPKFGPLVPSGQRAG